MFGPDTKRWKFHLWLCNGQYSLHLLDCACFPECPEEEYDHRSLFERLEEQKQKRELEYEEAHRLSKLPVNTKLSVRYMTNKCLYVYVIYFYSKTNQMHNISNLFYFGTTLRMFWTVSPSIIRSLRLYITASGTCHTGSVAASSHRTCMTCTWFCYVQS